MIGSFGFQAAALGFGGLSVVQPLMVSELLFLVLILRVWFGSPLGWREASGTVLTVAGLAGFLAMSNAGGGTTFPTTGGWIIVTAVCTGAVVICVGCTRVSTSRAWRSAWFGAGGGDLVRSKRLFHQGDDDPVLRTGFWQIFGHWEPYAIIVAGLAGLVLTQDAFHAGPDHGLAGDAHDCRPDREHRDRGRPFR